MAESKVISSGTQIQNPLQFFDISLGAGEHSQPIYFNYDYFRLLDLNGSALKVKFGASGSYADFLSGGIGFKCPEIVPTVQFFNDTANPLTARVAMAIGDITDDRLSLSGNVAIVNATGTQIETYDRQASSFDTDNIAVPATTATLLFAANASAKAKILKAGNFDLYIGNSNAVTNADGFLVEAGQSLTLGHGLDVYGYTLNADTVSIYEESY